jgi:hypothetical protein
MTSQPRSAAAVDFEETRPAHYFATALHDRYSQPSAETPAFLLRNQPEPPPSRLDAVLSLTWLAVGALLTLFALGLAISLLPGVHAQPAERSAQTPAAQQRG